MWLKLLRQVLSDRRNLINVFREIYDGKPLTEVGVKPTVENVALDVESRWWLERAFRSFKLSFTQGVFLVYALYKIPSLLLMIFMLGKAPQNFINAYLTGFFGDLFIPICLLLLNTVQKTLVELKDQYNELLLNDKFVAPSRLIMQKGTECVSIHGLPVEDVDKEYRNRYVKSVCFRTIQGGMNLAFNMKYQFGSGLVTSFLFAVALVARFVFNIVSPNVFGLWLPSVPEIDLVYLALAWLALGLDWFVVGMVAWSIFVAFLISMTTGGNFIRIRAFESVKEYFEPTTTLVLKNSFVLTFLVAWASPLFMFTMIYSQDPVFRQATINWIGAMVIIMMPIIILSFLLPTLRIHGGMEGSRKRALSLKKAQLEDIKKLRESDLEKYMKIQKHLISDYKSIQKNPEWVFSASQIIQIVGTIMLPIVTFLLSRNL